MGGFVPCVQMDAYANQHSPERKVVFAPYFQVLQAVVIQNPVIGAFTGGTFSVYCFVLFGIPWDTGMKTQVPMILYVDGASVTAGGTILFMWTGTNTSAFERAAVFVCILYGIVAPWAHFMPGRAEGMPCFVKSNVCGGIWG